MSLRVASLLTIGAGALGYYVYDPVGCQHAAIAVLRSYRTAASVISIVWDYKSTLSKDKQPEVIGWDAYSDLKSQVHQRSAEKLLALCRLQGGTYIKLGQHISALVFLLPSEYTETMKPLQDQCPPSSIEEIDAMLKQDLGSSIADLFEEFDPKPLGVASLAQVHKARLRSNGREVAVKLQHPSLDEFVNIDIQGVAGIVSWIKYAFPEFEFDWLATEMKLSLPKELDFKHEMENSVQVAKNFANEPILMIPEVYWASRRVLIMEFAQGSRIDDLKYMNQHNINPVRVSAALTRLYSEMIFMHGFVHCDPHPGNLFVRPKSATRRTWLSFFARTPHNPENFEIVLLDHGLYRTLSREFRLDYAHLWAACIRGDEHAIEEYSYKIFTKYDRHVTERADGDITHHRLFASMLTGRTWDVISGSGTGLATVRTRGEVNRIQNNASSGRFYIALAEILAKLPREMLLLLKTNDLLRSVDEALGVTGSDQEHMMRMVSVMGWYCALTIHINTVAEILAGRGWAAASETDQTPLAHGLTLQSLSMWADLLKSPRYIDSLASFWAVGFKMLLLDLLVVVPFWH
ncbi:ABC1 family-domain-containing protein [Polychytrium aggregatum]|uniref:ABC1 family-domain-containing protein n=1 Tax=Polychytrium aggregatum TaxID=110093 RepID=UPI0022FE1432|nr:ABC1 family-domain-containing protein [Polychytrium aggregatum]KAI9208482.1 ABC1 family-domain-containing protein [Polychytrium aggregatum]